MINKAVALIDKDVDTAPAEAYVYALSRANLARAVAMALEGKRREAKEILEREAETKLFGSR